MTSMNEVRFLFEGHTSGTHINGLSEVLLKEFFFRAGISGDFRVSNLARATKKVEHVAHDGGGKNSLRVLVPLTGIRGAGTYVMDIIPIDAGVDIADVRAAFIRSQRDAAHWDIARSSEVTHDAIGRKRPGPRRSSVEIDPYTMASMLLMIYRQNTCVIIHPIAVKNIIKSVLGGDLPEALKIARYLEKETYVKRVVKVGNRWRYQLLPKAVDLIKDQLSEVVDAVQVNTSTQDDTTPQIPFDERLAIMERLRTKRSYLLEEVKSQREEIVEIITQAQKIRTQMSANETRLSEVNAELAEHQKRLRGE